MTVGRVKISGHSGDNSFCEGQREEGIEFGNVVDKENDLRVAELPLK